MANGSANPPIDKFTGAGPLRPPAVIRLNRIVDEINPVIGMAGDKYIRVARAIGGTILISLNLGVVRAETAQNRLSAVTAQISGSIGTGGYYEASSLIGVSGDIDPTSSLTLPHSGEQLIDPGTDLVVENLAEVGNTSNWIQPDTWVEGQIVGTTNESTPRPVLRVFVPSPGMVGVVLAQSGGDDGAVPSTFATWTYNAYWRNADGSAGTQIGSAALPVAFARQWAAPTTQATKGVLFFDTTGAPVLWQADEGYTAVQCTS